jgi:hypothetical protein
VNWIVPNSSSVGGMYYTDADGKWLVPILINFRVSEIGAILVNLLRNEFKTRIVPILINFRVSEIGAILVNLLRNEFKTRIAEKFLEIQFGSF